MTIINTNTNESHENVSFRRGADIIGVHKKTIARWCVKRLADKTYVEHYNNFTIYFKATMHKKKASVLVPKNILPTRPKGTKVK